MPDIYGYLNELINKNQISSQIIKNDDLTLKKIRDKKNFQKENKKFTEFQNISYRNIKIKNIINKNRAIKGKIFNNNIFNICLLIFLSTTSLLVLA